MRSLHRHPGLLLQSAAGILVILAAMHAPAAVDTIVVTAQSAEIYTTPMSGAIPIGGVRRSVTFPVVSELPGWYEIRFGSRSGWIRDSEARKTRAGKLLGAGGPAAEGRTVVDSVRIIAESTDIHTAPAARTQVIGTAFRQEVFGLLSAQEGWYEVVLPNRTGWIWQGDAESVAKPRVTRKETAVPAQSQTAVPAPAVAETITIASPRAIIQSAPSDAAGFISTARAGDRFASTGRTNGWVSILYYGSQAWVRQQDCARGNHLAAVLPPSTGGRAAEGVATQSRPAQYPPTSGRQAGRTQPIKPARTGEPPTPATALEPLEISATDQVMPSEGPTAAAEAGEPAAQRQEPPPPAAPAAQRTLPTGATVVAIVTVVSVLTLIGLLLYLRYGGRTRVRRRWLHRPRRRCLIVARRTKTIDSYMLNHQITLEDCFREIGFGVVRVGEISRAEYAVGRRAYDVILVDWRLTKSNPMSTRWFTPFRTPGTRTQLIVYNVARLDQQNVASVNGTSYLGTSFSDRDLFALVQPGVLDSAANISPAMSTRVFGLDGTISSTGLADTFQFMALTQKTGCLLVERTGPYAIVYFERGRIVYASVPHAAGRNALFDVLDLKEGKFHFVSGKISQTRNCSYSALAIVMEWAYRSDEAARRPTPKSPQAEPAPKDRAPGPSTADLPVSRKH